MINPLILSIIAFVMYISLQEVNILSKPAHIIVPAILLSMFTPGMLLTIPPSSNGLFVSGQNTLSSALTHSVVVGGIYYLLTSNFTQFY